MSQHAEWGEITLCRKPAVSIPDSKFYRANMGPIWGRQDPDGPHVGPMNFAIWDYNLSEEKSCDPRTG